LSVNFSQLFKEKSKFLDIKVILVIAVLIICLVITKLWSVAPQLSARDFLPLNTSFFYEWTSQKSLTDNLPPQLIIFDDQLPMEKADFLRQNLGDLFDNLQEAIWFKVAGSEEDNYLVKFSKLSSKSFKNWHEKHPEVIYYQPSDNILMLTDSVELINSIKGKIIGHFTVNHLSKGINIYWQLNQPPDFLYNFSSFLAYSSENPEIFMNIQSVGQKQNKVNLFQINNQPLDIEQNVLFKIPSDFDLAIGFNASSTESLSNFLNKNLLIPIYDGLPYYNLSNQKISQYFLGDNIIFQDDDGWLMINQEDYQQKTLDLADSFEVQEINKVLPDGTAYTELIASQEQTIVEHEFADQKYWQIDGLFGIQLENYYYLSNRQYLIEDLITSDKKINNLWADCLDNSSYRVRDFIFWPTDKLPDIPIKAYLEENNLQSLDIFSYYNSAITGLQWCF